MISLCYERPLHRQLCNLVLTSHAVCRPSTERMQSVGLALSAELVVLRAAWVEAHKALFPGNAVLRQQARPEGVGLMCLLRKHP